MSRQLWPPLCLLLLFCVSVFAQQTTPHRNLKFTTFERAVEQSIRCTGNNGAPPCSPNPASCTIGASGFCYAWTPLFPILNVSCPAAAGGTCTFVLQVEGLLGEVYPNMYPVTNNANVDTLHCLLDGKESCPPYFPLRVSGVFQNENQIIFTYVIAGVKNTTANQVHKLELDGGCFGSGSNPNVVSCSVAFIDALTNSAVEGVPGVQTARPGGVLHIEVYTS